MCGVMSRNKFRCKNYRLYVIILPLCIFHKHLWQHYWRYKFVIGLELLRFLFYYSVRKKCDILAQTCVTVAERYQFCEKLSVFRHLPFQQLITYIWPVWSEEIHIFLLAYHFLFLIHILISYGTWYIKKYNHISMVHPQRHVSKWGLLYLSVL